MKPEYPAVVPAHVIPRLERCGITARAVSLALGYRMARNGYCTPTKIELADELGVAVSTVKRALRQLQTAGVLAVRQVGRHNRYSWIKDGEVQGNLFCDIRRITPEDREKYASSEPSESPTQDEPVPERGSPMTPIDPEGGHRRPPSPEPESDKGGHPWPPSTPKGVTHDPLPYKENTNMNHKETSSSLNNPETFTGVRRTPATGGGGGFQKIMEVHELAKRLIANFPVSLAEAKLDNPEALIAFARNLPGDRKYPMRYRLADTVAAANCVWRKNRTESRTTTTPQDRMFGILTKKPALIEDGDVDPVTRIIHAVNTRGLHTPPVRAVAAPEAGTRESLLDRVAGVLVCACGRREENPTRWDADATLTNSVFGAPVCPDCHRPGIHGNRAFHPENPEHHETPAAAMGGA